MACLTPRLGRRCTIRRRCAGLPGLSYVKTRSRTRALFASFCHLPERHRLTEAIFATIGRYLSQRGLVMRQGTLVDATITNLVQTFLKKFA